jgi:aminomethyltransferase
MIAVQGPRAIDLLVPLLGDAHKSLKYYYACKMPLAGLPNSSALVSRTGYTGEDGWEIVVDAKLAAETWARILDVGRPLGAMPAGLGARDTLRLEAGMPLYGHELTDEIDPYQAGLAFAVDLESRSFPGKDTLLERRVKKDRPVRVGWELVGRRVPREGYSVIASGQTVGHVTSGTFSPTLEKPIAMGYTRADQAEPGTEVAIDLRGRQEPARVVALPFYRRPTPGRKS